MIKRFAAALVVIALMSTAYLGIANGWNDLHHSQTTAQRWCSYLVMAYGVSALVALAGFLMKRCWAIVAMILWGILSTTSTFLSTMIWGAEELFIGTVAGISAAAIVFFPIMYIWRTIKKKTTH